MKDEVVGRLARSVARSHEFLAASSTSKNLNRGGRRVDAQNDREACNEMSVEQNGERTGRNETFMTDGSTQGNITENYGDSLPEYINVTLLDVNSTEVIDSFYFYEVS